MCQVGSANHRLECCAGPERHPVCTRVVSDLSLPRAHKPGTESESEYIDQSRLHTLQSRHAALRDPAPLQISRRHNHIACCGCNCAYKGTVRSMLRSQSLWEAERSIATGELQTQMAPAHQASGERSMRNPDGSSAWMQRTAASLSTVEIHCWCPCRHHRWRMWVYHQRHRCEGHEHWCP